MKNSKFRFFIIAFAMIALALTAMPAMAANIYYVDGALNPTPPPDILDVDDYWQNPNNWNEAKDNTGTHRIPADGDTLVFGTNGLEYVNSDVDLNGVSVNLPNSTSNLNRLQYRFIDSSGTGATLTLKEFKANYAGPHSVSVPLIAEKVWTDYRVGRMDFHSTINAQIIEWGRGGDIFVNDTATATTSMKIWKNTNGSGTEVQQNAAVITPQLDVVDLGIMQVNVDGGMGDASTTVNISNSGQVYVNAEQTTTFPGMINVGNYGVLIGDMTGADFADPGKNLSFTDNAIYADTTGGLEPTRGDLGGAALILKPIINGAAGQDYAVGEDNSTAIYKGVVLGSWSSTDTPAATLRAVTGSGDLEIGLIARTMKVGNTSDIQSPDTKTANIFCSSANLRINNSAVNNGDTSGDKVTTFNTYADPSLINTTVLSATGSGALIAAGQTFVVTNGVCKFDSNTNADVLAGKLVIGDKGGLLLNHTFNSVVGGELELLDGSAIHVPAAQVAALDALATNITRTGETLLVLRGNNGTWTTTPGTVFFDLMSSSNVVINCQRAGSTHGETTIDGAGLIIGDGQYVVTNQAGYHGEIKAGSIIEPFAPNIEIGFAAFGTMQISAPVNASATPGVTVHLGSETALETVTGSNNSTNVRKFDVPGGWLEVRAAITAELVDVQSHRVRTYVDQSLNNLNIRTGAILDLEGGAEPLVTVAGTLSGDGQWSDGQGVKVLGTGTVAPGNSIGELDGNILELVTGATLEIGLGADPAIDHDFLDISGALTLGTGLVLDVVNDGFLGAATTVTDIPVLEWGSLDDQSPDTAFSITSSDGSFSVGSLTISGNQLLLSGTIGPSVPAIPGDLYPSPDGDGWVDGDDLGVLLANWGPVTEPPENPADLYPEGGGDGVVDGDDLGVLLANWAPDPGPLTAGNNVAVPEPASFTLLLLGALAMLGIYRKR